MVKKVIVPSPAAWKAGVVLKKRAFSKIATADSLPGGGFLCIKLSAAAKNP